MIDDDEFEKITKKIHTVETKVNQLKSEIKKLPLIEKMAKAIDMKNLQDHVATMQEQQQKWSDRVIELQAEAERVTGIIEDVHQKV